MPPSENIYSGRSAKLWRYALFNLLLLVLFAAWYYFENRPVTLAEPQLADGKLQCVSYAPYYQKGRSPFVPLTLITHAQIEQDLALLARRFQCVRIYSMDQGLDYVPEAASRLGLKVLLGAWVGWSKLDNKREINLAIKRANQFPDTVIGLVVGNEVLLRREQTVPEMQKYLAWANAATSVPVTYADVWEYWLKYRELEQSVDFVTVHILPYWEDNPRSIDDADTHVKLVMGRLQRTFSKPIFIGETGWPSIGRQRGESRPSRVNQARYLREFVQMAERHGWHYNLIEGMDQPWKRLLEGTVGGYWGLYSSGLQPKFDFTGPVSERQDGWKPLFYALGGALVFGLLAMRAGEQRRPLFCGMLTLGALAGAALPLQLAYLATASRDVIEWISLSGVAAIGWLSLLGMPFLVMGSGQANENSRRARQVLRAALLMLVAGAAVASLLLSLDGRYRDFPLALFLLPVLQLSIGLRLLQIQLADCWQGWFYWILAVSVGTAIVCILLEPNNLQALLWAGLTVLLAYAAGLKAQTDIYMKK